MPGLVSCARCRHESPAEARFCGACGGPLEARCGACQTPNPTGNRFCQHCGASLTEAPPVWRTLAAVARLQDARGDAAGARTAWRQARAAVDAVRARVRRPELAAGFDRSPLVPEIYRVG